MVTGFVLFWFAARNLFPNNVAMQMVAGLVGLVLAMMIETVLMMLREQKMDLREAKIKQANERRFEAERKAA